MASGSEEYVKLTRVMSELEAALIVAGLDERGISARHAGGLVSEFRSEISAGVDVFVPESDLERARTALREIEQSRSG